MAELSAAKLPGAPHALPHGTRVATIWLAPEAGGPALLEPCFSAALADGLRERGHVIERVPKVGGGTGGIRFHGNGDLEGAACWRADGTLIGVAGGFARAGVRFLPEARRG